MYVYIYIYVCLCTHTTHTHVYIYIYIYIYMYACRYICTQPGLYRGVIALQYTISVYVYILMCFTYRTETSRLLRRMALTSAPDPDGLLRLSAYGEDHGFHLSTSYLLRQLAGAGSMHELGIEEEAAHEFDAGFRASLRLRVATFCVRMLYVPSFLPSFLFFSLVSFVPSFLDNLTSVLPSVLPWCPSLMPFIDAFPSFLP